MSTASSYQSSLGDDLKTDSKKYIILLQDSHAKSKRGVNSSKTKLKLYSKHEGHKVLKGSLWEQREAVSPNQSISSIGSGGSKLSSNKAHGNITQARKVELDSIEYDDLWLVCPESHVHVLTEHQCRLLLAIPDCEVRIKLFDNTERFEAASRVTINSEVLVRTRTRDGIRGVVRWQGRLTGKQGLWFGIEVKDACQNGLGESDGSLNGERYFSCTSKNALFANVANLTVIMPPVPERKARRSPDSKRAQSLVNGHLVNGHISGEESTNHCDTREAQTRYLPATNVNIGDKVVWPSVQGLERATVRWIGCLPHDENIREGETLVGVEFENPVGKGTGYYKKKKLFCAKKGHASLVPLDGLYVEVAEDLSEFSTPSPPSEFGDPKYSGLNADDILRSLDLKAISTEEDVGSPAASKRGSRHVNSNGSSPRRRSPHKTNVRYNSNTSSNHSSDSIDGAMKLAQSLTSPSRSPRSDLTALRVPARDKKPSSVGSISPRSWSQGSDVSPISASPQRISSVQLKASAHAPSSSPQVVKSPINQPRVSSPASQTNYTTPQTNGTNSPTCTKSKVCKLTPKASRIIEGSRVIVDGEAGVVIWIGYDISKPERYFAGVKMEKTNASCSNGWYGDERLVDSKQCDILFVNLDQCQLSSNHMNESNPLSQALEEKVLPIQTSSSAEYIGEWRGIQGAHNSCYMDASIYAMFCYSSVFDDMLQRPQTDSDLKNYKAIQETLRDQIINPLRKDGFVKSQSMYKLRQLLDELGLVKGLVSDEKDPEEFINLLVVDVFKLPMPIQLSNNQSSHTFHLFVERDARIAFPTIQELLEHSCAQEKLKFKNVPRYLVIHMPRFGKEFRLYNKVFPNIQIDLTDILEGASRTCFVCGESAVWECPECYQAELQWIKSSFCTNCSMTVHKHEKRADHMPIELKTEELFSPSSGTRPLLELNAVLCIKTSHYVAFTRSNHDTTSPWFLFDSMADRKGDQNIPVVVSVDKMAYWLTSSGYESIAKDYGTVPDNIKRLLEDGYIFFYELPKSRQYSNV